MRKFLPAILLIFLAACSPDAPDYEERSPDMIFDQAKEYLEDTNWPAAAHDLIEIERQHPHSDLAARGGYLAGYAHYKGKKYDEAVDALDHFIELHPAHENVDYALFLKSMCYFDQVSDVRREQRATIQALRTMLDLKERFPDSQYTKHVEKKIIMLKNFLAGKEMFIARKLLEEDNLLAALKRYQRVVQKYSESVMRPEALYRIVEIYDALHLEDKARANAVILGTNHPDSKWYAYARQKVEGSD